MVDFLHLYLLEQIMLEEDTYDPVLSEAVVFPETNAEVSKILKLCNEHRVPVVPFGTGTSLEGMLWEMKME